MHSKLKLFFCIFIIFPFSLIAQKGYEIKVKIPNLKNKQILLAHYLGSQSAFADDTVNLDKNGTGAFKGIKPLPQGLYMVFLPSRTYFELLIGDDQVFSIEADTTRFMETVKFTGCEECKRLYDFQRFSAKNQKEMASLSEQFKTAPVAEKDSIRKKVERISKADDDFVWKQINGLSPQSMLYTLLKSTRDVKIPDLPRDASGKVTDSAFQYKYYRAHYFDNFNYADIRLLRTPAYEQKIKFYIDKMLPPILDSIVPEVDRLIEKTRSNEELFRFMLGTLYNYYASSQIVGLDAVFVYIAEKYYIPFATWSSADFIEKLKKDLAKVKPTLLGQQAPPIKQLVVLPTDHFLAAKTDTALKSNPYLGNYLDINTIRAKFLILVFWEADCSHCQHAMPIIHNAYERLKDKGVEVLAVHAIPSVPGKRKWIDYINEHQFYDWINAWSPYNNDYRDSYNILAQPTILILDENKKIISKRMDPDKIEDIINFELNKGLSKKTSAGN
jgi:thiol-disulfide isomerase/thioredoxin